MAPTRSAEFLDEERRILLRAARESVACGVYSGSPTRILLEGLPECLTRHRASFITLQNAGQLRGCMGSLVATRPLIVDVTETACSAAFNDPRFDPVQKTELDALRIEISVLSPLTEIDARSEQMLLEALQPGMDGLVLEFADHRATFLPKMWHQIPEPSAFVDALKQKADLPVDFWSTDLRAYRYLTETFSEPAGSQAPT